jgi:hypothetical protein
MLFGIDRVNTVTEFEQANMSAWRDRDTAGCMWAARSDAIEGGGQEFILLGTGKPPTLLSSCGMTSGPNVIRIGGGGT